jgi:hypothetical protein
VTSQSVVTGSRALATNYQNTTGKPLFVNVTVNVSGGDGTTTGGLDARTDASATPTTIIGGCMTVATGGGTNGTSQCNISFWVLNNNYYRVVTASSGLGTAATIGLAYWTEWN